MKTEGNGPPVEPAEAKFMMNWRHRKVMCFASGNVVALTFAQARDLARHIKNMTPVESGFIGPREEHQS